MILRVRDGACLIFKRNPLNLRYEIEASCRGYDSKILWSSLSLKPVHKDTGHKIMKELHKKYKEDPNKLIVDMLSCDKKAVA